MNFIYSCFCMLRFAPPESGASNMPRTTTFFATVFAVLLSACGGGNSGNPAEASLPPLSGVYRTADGATAEFIADGTFRGPAGLGTFTNKRFDLERQEQEELVERLDDFHDDLLKLEGQIEALRKQINERG
jgi:hypothetical protein